MVILVSWIVCCIDHHVDVIITGDVFNCCSVSSTFGGVDVVDVGCVDVAVDILF